MISRTLTKSMLALTATALSFSALAATSDTAKTEAREARGGASWMLQRHDADGDGAISLQEFQAAGDAMFARLDADGDGRLSPAELAGAGRGWGKQDGERAGPRAERRSEDRAARMEQYRARWFSRMDADGDGYVTRAEFDDARLARFSALDLNGNGVIDADELPLRQGHGHRQGKRQGDCQDYGKRDGSGKRGF
jgi:Ca2+-binding EF-hand superfamily protein